ncbi:hypothetical protein CHELA1G11_20678 [Hyphomicrobiales bacterium]|nr:hypothetical protein CHELA1G11_20678 [Hyphomicrobiales bacterium]CAH1691383.1 hypothetical protein CHELA1G2_20992 [Hyphomicrobiales bacterium]
MRNNIEACWNRVKKISDGLGLLWEGDVTPSRKSSRAGRKRATEGAVGALDITTIAIEKYRTDVRSQGGIASPLHWCGI